MDEQGVHSPTNAKRSTVSDKDTASPVQTIAGKDTSNPFMTVILPKNEDKDSSSRRSRRQPSPLTCFLRRGHPPPARASSPLFCSPLPLLLSKQPSRKARAAATASSSSSEQAPLTGCQVKRYHRWQHSDQRLAAPAKAAPSNRQPVTTTPIKRGSHRLCSPPPYLFLRPVASSPGRPLLGDFEVIKDGS
ncbi:hypothetical protein H5410_032238 [Solanum commersonii]|uniref:Uncharacterized protein n=1 Tax=Solanum commersonii TaxID=4109 RepID=A0A9J5YP33_SOLCO|nr:hypothetical protein H5410_032238 [Solanum commersonii]